MQHATVRPAVVADKRCLEALQMRASLENPEDRAAVLAHPEWIVLPLEQIEAGQVFVAEVSGLIKGFATLLPREDGHVELDGLFVEPDAWRQGIGRNLVEHCCAVARIAGAAAIHVIGNSHAEGFYKACGFELLGTQPMQFGVGLRMQRALP